ncbi:uncharacterized protein LOC128965468 [Oppia nitens]|uniref:uncharacterized protein LOC128965468 n=1 Tax=Oppia nitens TaxID=1686743 RepID=UPI0023DA26F0|nr:uncharacterized protein LOC128965468 [Oppia nitens]
MIIDNKTNYKQFLKHLPTSLNLKHIKETLDRDTACCLLGRIAADKGYHCRAMFYEFNIQQRNANRAHNRKLSFYGRDKIPHFGEKLMNRFEKCLAKKSFIFNKCCQLVANEKSNILKPQYNTIQHYLYNLSQNSNKRKFR